jgi:AcrR family transcriptional regulator
VSARSTNENPAPEEELDRIHRALIDVVFERGLEETTEAMVCERAQVEAEAFGRHYASLEEACTHIVEIQTGRFEEISWSTYGKHDNWRDGLRAAAYASTRYLEDNPRLARFTLTEILRADLRTQAARDRFLQRMVDIFDLGRTELEDPDSIGRDVAEGALGAVYARGMAESREDSKFGSMVEVLPELMYVIVASYLGAEAAQEELERGPADLARYRRGEI